MGKMKTVLILLFITFYGCSTTIVKERFETQEKYYSRVNDICKNENDVTIKLLDSTDIEGNDIFVASDSTSIIQRYNNLKLTFPTSKISELKICQRSNSMLEGFLFGGLIGGIISPIFFPSGAEKPSGYGVFLGIPIGGLIGLVYGLYNPGIINIEIN